MKKAAMTYSSGYWIATTLCLLSLFSDGITQNYDGLSRSMFLSHGPNKGGWRPIVTSGSGGASYNIGNIHNTQPPATQKIMSAPVVESKISHYRSVPSEFHSVPLISTSIRPLVTRDVNKVSALGQSFKTSHYPLNSINYNAPIKSYANPFVLNGNQGLNYFNGYQYDNSMFIRHPQPMVNHRPSYNNPQSQIMLGKRLKANQLQAQILQQLAVNQYHQNLQSFQNNHKKPNEQQPRPVENYAKPNNHVQKPVNPHESLSKQTKAKTQNVAPVTYKPPLGSQFQQFGLQEESFAPIPSSILGSFSSFGHASVKARDPNYTSGKPGYSSSSSTRSPYISNDVYSSTSTINTDITPPPKDKAILSTSNLKTKSTERVKDDYSNNLVPPPNIQTQFESFSQKNNFPTKNSSSDVAHAYSSSSINNNFIPSPLDPLSKYQENFDSSRFPSVKLKQHQTYVYNTNLPTKKPIATSFFDSTLSPVATTDPFEPQSTNVVPENLLVQLPPPYTSFSSYNGHVKLENTNFKDKYQAFSSINHNTSPTKYKIPEDVQYFPPRGQGYFDTKFSNYQSNPKRNPTQHKYEVTESWEPSGEGITQPTLHSWLNPSQSFQQFGNILSSSTPYKESPKKVNQIQHQPYYPTSVPSKTPVTNLFDDATTVYSTITENKQHTNYIENTLSVDTPSENEKPEFATSSQSPVYDVEQEESKTTSESYDEVTTRSNTRRKPSRYRIPQETSTASSIDEDFTTKFETFKEHIQETENDLQPNDLPTIPPSKFFKRPVLTTSASDTQNEEKTRKRNKLKRRRPSRLSTTPEYPTESAITTTEETIRSYRYKTTTLPTDVEEVTKPLRSKYRFSHKSRTTRPTSQSDSTSSAQPTMLPTTPVTLRPKLHSRIRSTTLSSLDFEDLSETTTNREPKVSASVEQSSIMKIAKDHSFYRPSSNKYIPTGIGIFNESPDYSHKQDEKDTPTSDISVNTSDNKYSAQKLRDGSSGDEQIDYQEPIQLNTSPEIQTAPTMPTFMNEKPETTQVSQSNRVEQLFNDQKSGNRGSTKSEDNQVGKEEATAASTIRSSEEIEVSTTPISLTTKPIRVKNKSSKYDTNRPRFSVKDYRNRLSQYTSTSTEKPPSTDISLKQRFPNRSRFPSFKDPYGDSKVSGSEQSTSTEQPRKKFMPKDPRHKGENNNNEESLDNNVVSPSQKNVTSENNVTIKPSRVRGSLRRDPNRKRITTTETPVELGEKPKINNVYTNLKRPSLPNLRKRVQIKNKVPEFSENTEPTITVANEVVMNVDEENKPSTEKSTSETAIMKIAKDDRKHPVEEVVTSNASEDPSQRVADLTLAASKEYNTSGLFKSVSPNARRVPDYFTIATDDPILPIEAFFPQLNQKKES